MTDAQATAKNVDPCERFEALLEGGLGDCVRRSEANAAELWSALTNTVWHGPQSEQARFTFRSAGDVVAQIRGEGDYTDWYMSGPHGKVADWIASPLGQYGWTRRPA